MEDIFYEQSTACESAASCALSKKICDLEVNLISFQSRITLTQDELFLLFLVGGNIKKQEH